MAVDLNGWRQRILSKLNTPPWRATPDGSDLIELDEWNKQRRKFWQDCRAFNMQPSLFANGIKCPQCGGNLYDTNRVLSQSPVVLQVKCQGCDFKGERYE